MLSVRQTPYDGRNGWRISSRGAVLLDVMAERMFASRPPNQDFRNWMMAMQPRTRVQVQLFRSQARFHQQLCLFHLPATSLHWAWCHVIEVLTSGASIATIAASGQVHLAELSTCKLDREVCTWLTTCDSTLQKLKTWQKNTNSISTFTAAKLNMSV